jgi:hypothetical protein
LQVVAVAEVPSRLDLMLHLLVVAVLVVLLLDGVSLQQVQQLVLVEQE